MNTIYLIRHAEKPEGVNQGVNEQGAGDPESLIPRGWQRAGALATFFEAKDGLLTPNRIYAASANKEKIAPHDKVGSHSARPMETVAPLAAKLNLVPVTTFTKGDEQALVTEVLGLIDTTLISWQHEAIPEIADFILGAAGKTPGTWPDDRFDVVWRFVNDGAGNEWTFSQVCQQLLSGDQAQPI